MVTLSSSIALARSPPRRRPPPANSNVQKIGLESSFGSGPSTLQSAAWAQRLEIRIATSAPGMLASRTTTTLRSKTFIKSLAPIATGNDGRGSANTAMTVNFEIGQKAPARLGHGSTRHLPCFLVRRAERAAPVTRRNRAGSGTFARYGSGPGKAMSRSPRYCPEPVAIILLGGGNDLPLGG